MTEEYVWTYKSTIHSVCNDLYQVIEELTSCAKNEINPAKLLSEKALKLAELGHKLAIESSKIP